MYDVEKNLLSGALFWNTFKVLKPKVNLCEYSPQTKRHHALKMSRFDKNWPITRLNWILFPAKKNIFTVYSSKICYMYHDNFV